MLEPTVSFYSHPFSRLINIITTTGCAIIQLIQQHVKQTLFIIHTVSHIAAQTYSEQDSECSPT